MSIAHTEDDAEQYRRILNGDTQARNRMAEQHMGLVQKIATYYAKRNPMLDMDDLIQEGRIGIIVALEKFDVDAGYRFSTYATYWVKHYVQRYVVANHSRAASTRKKDTEAYLSERMDAEEIALYEARCISYTSLHGGNDKRWDHLEEFLNNDEQSVEDFVETSTEWEAIKDCLFHDSIDGTERLIICMKYGILGFDETKPAKIAAELGITKQAVITAESSCFEKIEKLLGDNHD